MAKFTEVLVFLFFAFELSCGLNDPKVEPQSSEARDLLETDPGLLLNHLDSHKADSKETYTGSILVWKSDVQAADLRDLMQQKETINSLDLEYKQIDYKIDALRRELGSLDQKMGTKKLAISKFDFTKIYENRDDLFEHASAYLEGEIQGKGLSLAFSEYCESKIWQFAVSDLLKFETFSARPSPAGVCENFYKNEGYFVSSTCSFDGNMPEKDFFPCFWSETGVFKTKVHLYDEEFEEVEGARLKAIQSEIIKKSQQTVDLKTERRFASPNLIQDGFFDVEVEGKKREFIIDFSDSPLDKPVAEAEKTFLQLLGNKELKEALKILGKERKSDSQEKRDEQSYTFNDRIYNLHLMNQGSRPSSESLNLKSSDFNELNLLARSKPALYGPSISDADLKEVSYLRNELESLGEQVDLLNKVISHYENPLGTGIGQELEDKYTAWMNQRGKTAQFIVEHDMVHAFWPYAELSIERRENLIQVKFYVDNKVRQTTPALACFDTISQVQTNCDIFENETKHLRTMDLSLDKTMSGQIEIDIQTPETSAFYLSELTTSPYFQEAPLSRSMLSQKRLRLSLLKGRFEGALPILNGRIELLDTEGIVEYEGSVGLSLASLSKRS